MGSAQTRKFFGKNLTKNFHTWVRCEHNAFNGWAHKIKTKKGIKNEKAKNNDLFS